MGAMSRERVLQRPYGRKFAPCTALAYSVRVDDYREQLGKRVKRERDRLGYTSQKAFGDFANLHERSVAGVERGQKMGETVLGRIEDALGWPEYSATKYLETGDETAFNHPEPDDDAELSDEELLRMADDLASQLATLQEHLRKRA